MLKKIFATAFAVGILSWLGAIYSVFAGIVSAQVAAGQFNNNDTEAAIALFVIFAGTKGLYLIFAVTVWVIFVIWRPEISRAWKWLGAGTAVIIAVTVTADPSSAFFDKADKTEAYTIMPNESAFWIPDTGANKDSQAQFDSEAYLNQNKLAVKRYIIPHQKLPNSGGYIAWDYYVPTGRLIILDRTPYSREWVDADDRGTSKTKEGFPCQTKEGLNIIAGVSIGASVMERDAAKFLYRFGVKSPTGDRTSGEVIFTSVYYGRSLKDVMDDVGRKKVQTLVCAEIAARTFDQANAESNEIMASVENLIRAYFSSVGITLDFIGWGDTFEFDKDVQKAVNDAYAAAKLQALLPVLEALATLKIQEGLGKGLGEKGVPVVVTPGMIEALTGLVKTPAPR